MLIRMTWCAGLLISSNTNEENISINKKYYIGDEYDAGIMKSTLCIRCRFRDMSSAVLYIGVFFLVFQDAELKDIENGWNVIEPEIEWTSRKEHTSTVLSSS